MPRHACRRQGASAVTGSFGEEGLISTPNSSAGARFSLQTAYVEDFGSTDVQVDKRKVEILQCVLGYGVIERMLQGKVG